MLSLVQPNHYYQTLLSQGVGLGLSMSMLFLPSVSIMSQYFRQRRALAMGMTLIGEIYSNSLPLTLRPQPMRKNTGSSAGGIIWPILFNHLFNGTTGFRWAVR